MGGDGAFSPRHMLGRWGREAWVPASKKRLMCILDANTLLPALSRQLAAPWENVLVCSLASNFLQLLLERDSEL